MVKVPRRGQATREDQPGALPYNILGTAAMCGEYAFILLAFPKTHRLAEANPPESAIWAVKNDPPIEYGVSLFIQAILTTRGSRAVRWPGRGHSPSVPIRHLPRTQPSPPTPRDRVVLLAAHRPVSDLQTSQRAVLKRRLPVCVRSLGVGCLRRPGGLGRQRRKQTLVVRPWLALLVVAESKASFSCFVFLFMGNLHDDMTTVLLWFIHETKRPSRV